VTRGLAAAAAVLWMLGGATGGGGGVGVARAQTPAPVQTQTAAPMVAEGPVAAVPVDITVVGKPADLERVRALGGARTPGGVPLRWNRVDRFDPLADVLRAGAADPATPLRCWVDMTEAHRVVLYFAARGGQRFLVRGVELSGRFDELDRQSLAQVLELSISALLESGEAGISRSEARVLLSRGAAPAAPALAGPPGVVSAPPPAEASRVAVAGEILYGARALGTGMPLAHGPGAGLSLRRSRSADSAPGTLGLWVSGQYQVPASARSADIGLQLQTLSARAGLEVERWRLRARLGAGADWVRVAPLAGNASAPVTLASAHWSTSLVVTGGLALLIPVGPRLAAAVALSADMLPTAVHYDLQSPGGSRTAFAPWRVRPGLSLELRF
jgi:hypothetical protein